MNSEYIPGVCNIGKPELNRRKFLLYVTLPIIVLAIAALYYFQNTDLIYYIFLFMMIAFAAVMFFQISNRFCVSMGMQGTYNFGKTGHREPIRNPDFVTSDRRKSMGIIFSSIMIAAIITTALYFWIKTLAEQL